MNSNENVCKNLRHGIYMDGYDIKINKTESIMKEGAARIERQANEIESLTAENERNRQGFEFHASLADKRYWKIESLTTERDRLRSAMQASIKILDSNLGRQEEKLYDIKPILLAAMRNGA